MQNISLYLAFISVTISFASRYHYGRHYTSTFSLPKAFFSYLEILQYAI